MWRREKRHAWVGYILLGIGVASLTVFGPADAAAGQAGPRPDFFADASDDGAAVPNGSLGAAANTTIHTPVFVSRRGFPLTDRTAPVQLRRILVRSDVLARAFGAMVGWSGFGPMVETAARYLQDPVISGCWGRARVIQTAS